MGDSSKSGLNGEIANGVARMLQPALKRFCPDPTFGARRELTHVRCATQRDGVSCGVFLLEFVERKLRGRNVQDRVEDVTLGKRRGEVRALLEKLCNRMHDEEVQNLLMGTG